MPSRPSSSLSTHIEQENTYTVGYNVRQDGYSLCLTQRVLHTYFMYVVTLSWLFLIYVQCMTSVQWASLWTNNMIQWVPPSATARFLGICCNSPELQWSEVAAVLVSGLTYSTSLLLIWAMANKQRRPHIVGAHFPWRNLYHRILRALSYDDLL